MFKRILAAALIALLIVPSPTQAEGIPRAQALVMEPKPPAPQPVLPEKEKGLTTEQKAAIIAALIAASVAAYLAMGRPCACPYSSMRNGGSCGNRSAWSKPGGFKPLCYPTDITDVIFANWLKDKKLPPLR